MAQTRTLNTLAWNTLYAMWTSFEKENKTTAASRILEYVDAQIDESRSYCEDKPHISHLLSWDRSLGRPFDLPRGSRYSSPE